MPTLRRRSKWTSCSPGCSVERGAYGLESLAANVRFPPKTVI